MGLQRRERAGGHQAKVGWIMFAAFLKRWQPSRLMKNGGILTKQGASGNPATV